MRRPTQETDERAELHHKLATAHTSVLSATRLPSRIGFVDVYFEGITHAAPTQVRVIGISYDIDHSARSPKSLDSCPQESG